MAWDMRYRPLKEGEIILLTDEVQEDDGTWRVGCRCSGQPAPNPNYTSHRVYRRLVKVTHRKPTYHGLPLSELARGESYHPGDDA
jgi:hypothetical protein